MLGNYFKIALRNILKYKGYSTINVLGLAMGMAIFFLTLSLVMYELSFDKFHSKGADIYRIHQKFNDGGTTSNVSYPIKEALVNDYKQIELATSFAYMGGARVRVDDRQLIANEIVHAEPSFFDMFDIEFVKGSKELAQKKFATQQNDAFITEESAKNLFGDVDPIGKTFSVIQFDQSYTVAGIVRRLPRNSHFNFNIILPLSSHPQRKEVENNWNNPVVFTYVYIPDKAMAATFNEKELDTFIARHFPKAYGGENAHLPVIALTDIHLFSHNYYELGSNSTIAYVSIVSSVGFIILLLASINFMNLTTARSARRSREVGMRKALGAPRSALVLQFIGESVVISLLSIVVGAWLAYLLLPVFNENLGQHLEINFLSNKSIAMLLGISLAIGIAAGTYPAFFLSAFNPIRALKSNQPTSLAGFFVRKGLVLFQFVIVTSLLVGIIALGKQIDFMANKDLGYDSNNLVYVRSSDKMRKENLHYQAFVDEVGGLPGVSHISGISDVDYQTVVYEGMPLNERKGALIMLAGPAYPEALGIGLVSGRYPSKEIRTDNKSIMLNETLLGELGWTPLEALGKTITLYEGDSTYTVIGVLKDFHMGSVTDKILGLGIISVMDRHFNYTAIRLTGDRNAQAEAAIKKAWMRFDDGWSFDIYHDRDGIAEQLKGIRNLGVMVQECTYLGIVIACIGLFGLSSFSAERRTKEIGVRKVHGASITSLWRLLVLEFANIVIAASLFGVVIGFFIVEFLMKNFAYRAEIGISVYLGAVLAAVFIAVATVSYQAIRSARTNPVNSLRTE